MLSHKQAMINQENGKQTIQDLKNPTLADAQNALNEYKKAPQVSDRDKELAAELFKNTIKIGKRLNETNQTTFIKKLLNDPMLKDPTSAEFQALFQASDIYSKNVLLKKFPLPENYTAEDMQKFIFIGNHLLKSDQYLNYDAQQRIFYVTPSKAVSIYQLFDNATAFGSRPAGQKMKVFFLQSFKDKFMNSPPNTQIDILNELINPKNPALQKTIEDPEILNFLIQIIQERAKFYENQYNDLEKTKPGIAISFADEWNGEGPNESLKKWMSKIKNARIYHIKFQTLLQDTPQVSTLTAQQESAKNQARRTAINQNLRILDLPETDPIPTAKQIETAYEKSTQRALENLPRPLREAQQANNAATFNALAKQTAYSDAASIYKQKMNTLDAAKQALQNLVSTQQA
ncbi:hypothetical protein A3J41_01580 [candidate division TM6 bacterium RIFCSPHIGHO2_12_FULL_38_8]|nr:MAG: hypothetical protein A3J41_01580 [candidate division TM6 bacterium RIFCSPHIGHO2_12_FULL_38_8]